MSDLVPLTLGRREVPVHKALGAPQFGVKNVLTNSPWKFVSLWLQREKKTAAAIYWDQAREFHEAAADLPLRSAPLVRYYCYMNAAKALLSAKGIQFDEHHGVRAYDMRRSSNKSLLSNEGVRILNRGIAPSLATYLSETESLDRHSLQDLLFNMVFVHRTYCLTYRSQSESFIPLKFCKYFFDAIALFRR